MNITELSIRRPVTTIMLFVSMVAIGLIAAFRLPLESQPEATAPFFFVQLPYTGSTPEEEERNLVRPRHRQGRAHRLGSDRHHVRHQVHERDCRRGRRWRVRAVQRLEP